MQFDFYTFQYQVQSLRCIQFCFLHRFRPFSLCEWPPHDFIQHIRSAHIERVDKELLGKEEKNNQKVNEREEENEAKPINAVTQSKNSCHKVY